ncbi:cupin 2 barrel domain-containing protein [Halosimplex carlsbadense 2-9-1]|uniref:Cupin 2 barrel domain-containing protein n=1 Tax=Halosimplex carlsbadense 2-9-1 TaxID=797114 RepID=M0D1I3_9EURY|nr:cupin domain-containing protein [Halosimplex carlsbadense]ELZ29310.1 cupin 2 barrel domain-containing protein [Halosimplex carlsbadense 2-9-1]
MSEREATDDESTADPATPTVRRAEDIEYEPVDAAEGLSKAVLVGEDHGAENLAIRRFTLAPGAEVPKHRNEIEHEQYVLAGEYVVGIDSEASETPRVNGEAVDGEEHTVKGGDALHIPAGAVHWYRNERDLEGAFLCAVPTGDDAIELVEE